MEQGLALPASPISLRTPTTERNVSLHRRPHRPEMRAPWEPSAMVPIATLAHHRVQRVLDRHRTIALFVPLARTSLMGAALGPMKMASVQILA